ncbi:alpha,alpha-trehalase TreA [Salinicola lusitanus]|uniref:alpha,alpha-trehalase TreA n=1 Tax=Salinicola lusitanus TaxID=1949085 RepID=UPI000DA194C5|nr:alpha,alpha-trehalase TreA [Salinicola lusitanus]
MTTIGDFRQARLGWATLLLAGLLLGGCSTQGLEREPSREPPAKTASQSPDRSWGPVMEAVAMAKLYPDGKSVVDLVPKRDPAAIVADFEQLRQREGTIGKARLQAFVDANFDPRPENETRLGEDADTSIEAHIVNLWPYLTRDPADTDEGPWSSLVSLPEPYVVPGGRFNEMFYWDSYFTMLGLARSDRFDLVRDMVGNFAWLIDTYGFVPNGTRTYFLTRSQPPFFAPMVALLAEHDGDDVYRRYLPELMREHDYWMRGADEIGPGEAREHVVELADGTLLNRYHGSENWPRPEAYAAERELAARSDRPAPELYGHLRAAAESGWDFSSRWMADGQHQTTIETRDILPVDLNALLYQLERTLARAWRVQGDAAQAARFEAMAERRQSAINRVFWQQDGGYYTDYDWREGRLTDAISAAMVYPLAFGVADPARADATAATVRRELLRAGGMVTTTRETGEQWDAPNGWAPLQWLAVAGLDRYGHDDLAETIARRWIETNREVYRQTGKLVEKYDVVDPAVGGGGEYDVVDGFGWTNGVLLDLIHRYPAAAHR